MKYIDHYFKKNVQYRGMFEKKGCSKKRDARESGILEIEGCLKDKEMFKIEGCSR